MRREGRRVGSAKRATPPTAMAAEELNKTQASVIAGFRSSGSLGSDEVIVMRVEEFLM